MYYYSYDGPVMSFGRCVTRRWKSHTYANTDKKAKSNLAYQYKKQFGLASNANISLPEDVVILRQEIIKYGGTKIKIG